MEWLTVLRFENSECSQTNNRYTNMYFKPPNDRQLLVDIDDNVL